MLIPTPPEFPQGAPPEPSTSRPNNKGLFSSAVMADPTLVPTNVTFSTLDPVLKRELEELDRIKNIAEAQHAHYADKEPIIAERYMRNLIKCMQVRINCIDIYAKAAIGAARVAVSNDEPSKDPASRALEINPDTYEAIAEAIVSAQRGGPA